MNDDELLETIRLFLPKYLTPGQAKELWSELAQFPTSKNYYWANSDQATLLQGDAWTGLVVLDFESGARRQVTGVILSNSCDIAPENPRNVPPRVLFAPLIELARIEERLQGAGIGQDRIDSFLSDLRRQRVTTAFHVPSYSDVLKESVVFFDDIHAHPIAHFLASEDRVLRFRLNQSAFYMLLMKLSIHFCRFQENVARFGTAA